MEQQNISKLIENLIPKYKAWLATKKIQIISEIESDCYAKADAGQIRAGSWKLYYECLQLYKNGESSKTFIEKRRGRSVTFPSIMKENKWLIKKNMGEIYSVTEDRQKMKAE